MRNYTKRLKKNYIKTQFLLVMVAIIFFLQFSYNNNNVSSNIEQYYLLQLNNFEKNITSFRKDIVAHLSQKQLQQRFFNCRLAYKKVAVLSEFFNGYETKLLNGPALDWVIEDNPGTIIFPQGLQVAEQLVFSTEWKKDIYQQLQNTADDILKTIYRLKNEPGLINKFNDEQVWDAIRSATIRLIALGITGYDSPIAQYSLTEARTSLSTIKDILLIFKKKSAGNTNSITSLVDLINKADIYLAAHNAFNHFDRFVFISQYINPFYSRLVTTRQQLSIPIPQGSNPVDLNAQSIFAAKALNIDFYSPGKDYLATADRILLGKKLFSDPILSSTRTRSCASCHKPEQAFTDGLKVPTAMDEETILTRNTPTLWNSALQTKQFMDSRTDVLENQLDQVVHNTNEMKGSLKAAVIDLKKDTAYFLFFKKAYANQPEPVNPFTIGNAISSYVRSLLSYNSRFDKAINSTASILTTNEIKGFNLFMGKAKCATCHFIPVFNGLVPPIYTETESEVIGVPETKNKKPAIIDPDLGKFYFSTATIHKYSFKTPTIRNIELTPPYMHNGVFTTLEEVMEFYNNGGGKGLHIAPPNQTLPFEKLNLSKKEIADVIAFMKTLTDTATTR
jgi:cytochrome c peroxidase